jgi:hypothetical protein
MPDMQAGYRVPPTFQSETWIRMPTTLEPKPERIVGPPVERYAPSIAPSLERPVVAALFAAGLVFIAGSIADYVILWLINRQDGPQWEISAVVTTVEGMSRILLGIALVFAALYVRGRPSIWLRRVLGIGLLSTAFAGLVLAALMAMDFLALRSLVRPEAMATFQAATAKTLFLCGLYIILTGPAGVIALRTRRGRS